ncbi:uncharacterized protein GIQ15_06860 [Arthroderma uncinatum]|uniref:uncharacterized protein n=1 Tax=Arthroderma uncinatum TaxID=74035 RepID=UPI00144A924C|nr:uncharacterized protein GIQ15_06860 [Arthroderma uncinatum]KAF3479884.1 hypothetical protein GIQ15_06860 [Arthroderma uncinatum]
MCDQWKAPNEGTPCWIEIFATDLARAEKFYSTVFNWTFDKACPGRTDEISVFRFPDKCVGSLGGSISKINPGEHTIGPKTIKLYLYVNDLEKTMEKIVANGGKKCSDVVAEGEHGEIMHLQDTEGNGIGIYSTKKK